MIYKTTCSELVENMDHVFVIIWIMIGFISSVWAYCYDTKTHHINRPLTVIKITAILVSSTCGIFAIPALIIMSVIDDIEL